MMPGLTQLCDSNRLPALKQSEMRLVQEHHWYFVEE